MKLHFFQWLPQSSNAQANLVPLVFLHGMGGTGQIWRGITAQLDDEFRCIAFDQRGHGQSRPVLASDSGFHAEDYARDVLETLNEMGVSDFTLIGHSMGVRTALAMAHLAPSLIKTLIAVDLGISSEWGGGIGRPLACFLEALPRSFITRSLLKEYLERECPDPSIAQYLLAVAKKTRDAPETWVFPFEREALVQTIEQADETPIETWVNESLEAGVPMHFLRGETSRVWLKPDYEAQKEKFKHPLIHFEEWQNCGHGLPFEQRARFVEFIRTQAV